MFLTVQIFIFVNAVFFFLSVFWGFSGTVWQQNGLIVRPHLYAGFFSVVITCAVHCIVMFYFIGTGRILKDALFEKYPAYFESEIRTFIRASKSGIFSWGTLSILAMLTAGILGGAVSAGKISGLVHLVASVAATFVTVKSFVLTLKFTKQNAKIMDLAANFIDEQNLKGKEENENS
ncbi:hypothetical protein IT568_00070 [bacterium]|nr:hypothetical protein [bacterium]